MQTSLHTSDIQLPIVSQTSLCLIEGKPPFEQESACSTEKGELQAQLVGQLLRQKYFKLLLTSF